jgi:hypothetical protein
MQVSSGALEFCSIYGTCCPNVWSNVVLVAIIYKIVVACILYEYVLIFLSYRRLFLSPPVILIRRQALTAILQSYHMYEVRKVIQGTSSHG